MSTSDLTRSTANQRDFVCPCFYNGNSWKIIFFTRKYFKIKINLYLYHNHQLLLIPLDGLRQQMASTDLLICLMDLLSQLIWLATIWYCYWTIQKLTSDPVVNLNFRRVLYIRFSQFFIFCTTSNISPVLVNVLCALVLCWSMFCVR